jgi:polyphenol oxidase
MDRVLVNGLHLWQFENLRKQAVIRHFITERNSWPDRREFTLSFSSLPDKEQIRRNRSLLAEAIGVPDTKLFFPSQVHKTRIMHVTHETRKEDLMETDALITDEKGICIAVMSADCVPILLFDTKNNVAAAVHSGWRGTVARILEKTLNEMMDIFGTRGEDIVASIGPSVCQESYEVGAEVVLEVTNAFGKESGLMRHKSDSKAHLDLWKANKIQLVSFGVPEQNIEISELCTVKMNDHFFSARKGDTGRFAAGIMMI